MNYTDIGEKLLRKRKFYVSFIIVFTVLLLLVFNLGSWIFLNRMGDYLDGELGRRLASITRLTAGMIEGVTEEDFSSLDETSIGFLLIQPRLTRIQAENQLEGIYIVDKDLRILISGRRKFFRGEQLTYLQEDSAVVAQAWLGSISVSPLHVVAGNRFKSAYAPLQSPRGEITAILVVEASADFFNILKLFRRGLIVGGLASLGSLIFFSSFLYWAISLLIKTQESLRRSERLAALGQMAATVAHEIRNPLGVIKGTADVLKDRYDNKANPDELFNYISTEVRRLNRLVNDFLSFSKEPQLNPKTGDLATTIQKAVSALEHDFQQAGVKVNVNLPSEIDPLMYDEDAVHQVLFNLLLNALQSIGKDGCIDIVARPKMKKGKSVLAVEVRDTGRGIRGEVEKIFDPFYTTKTSGSGLGLAISKRLIEKHGGWFEVESQPDKGTTMRFYLPVRG